MSKTDNDACPQNYQTVHTDEIDALMRKCRRLQEENEMEYLKRAELVDALRCLMATINHERKTGLCQGSEWIRPMDRAQALLDKY